MKADKSIKVLITGHTDNTGDAAKNLNYYALNSPSSSPNPFNKIMIGAISYYCLFSLQMYYLLGIYKQ